MKKMVDATEGANERGFSFSGRSTEDGILIRAHKGDVTTNEELRQRVFFDVTYPGAFAYRDKDGKINVIPEGADEDGVIEGRNEMVEKETGIAREMSKWFLIVGMVFMFAAIITCIWHMYLPYICFFVSFMCLGFAKIPMVIYCFVKSIFGDEEKRQCFRFHAAEHAVINAYYDLKRIPTLDEIKNYSSFSPRCGIARQFKEAWFYFCLAFARLWPTLGGYLIILALMAIFTFCWAKRKNYFFTEIFALRKPEDRDYEVAIAAMKQALEYRDELAEMDEHIGVTADRILTALINGDDPLIAFGIQFEDDDEENIPR